MLLYVQDSGKLFDYNAGVGVANILGICYAGRGPGLNNPALQDRANIGPLPQGKYSLSEAIAGTHLGPYVFKLIPDPSNEMFGRSDFYIHWDNALKNYTASAGCIVTQAPTISLVAAMRSKGAVELEVVDYFIPPFAR